MNRKTYNLELLQWRQENPVFVPSKLVKIYKYYTTIKTVKWETAWTLFKEQWVATPAV